MKNFMFILFFAICIPIIASSQNDYNVTIDSDDPCCINISTNIFGLVVGINDKNGNLIDELIVPISGAAYCFEGNGNYEIEVLQYSGTQTPPDNVEVSITGCNDITVIVDPEDPCCINITTMLPGLTVHILDKIGNLIDPLFVPIEGGATYCFENNGNYTVQAYTYISLPDDPAPEDIEISITGCNECENEEFVNSYFCENLSGVTLDDCTLCFDVYLGPNSSHALDLLINGVVAETVVNTSDEYQTFPVCYEFPAGGEYTVAFQNVYTSGTWPCGDEFLVCIDDCGNPPECPELRIVAFCGWGNICDPCDSDFSEVTHLAVQVLNTDVIPAMWEFSTDDGDINWFDENDLPVGLPNSMNSTFIEFEPGVAYATLELTSLPPLQPVCLIPTSWNCEEPPSPGKAEENSQDATNKEYSSQIILSPNPANNYLTIGSSSNFAKNLEIINADGRVMMNESLQGQSNTIDLSALNNGVYFINISNAATDELITTEKIVVLK